MTADVIASGRAVLGIELGSTRIKACLIDPDGATLATANHGWENQFIDGVWTYTLDDVWRSLQACYAALADAVEAAYAVRPQSYAAIGISAMMHGYLAFDDAGDLLVPFRTWRNTSTAAAAAQLTSLFGFNIPQRWSVAHLYQAILDDEPHLAVLSSLTTLAGYVHWRLTGLRVIGVGDASGMFPVDPGTRTWTARMLSAFDGVAALHQPELGSLAALLPEVLVAGQSGGRLTPDGALLIDPAGDLRPGIPLCPPEGDAGTGMVATNCVSPRTANVSVGTSIFAMVVLDEPLDSVHDEIDIVTTPAGDEVAMVHCNNGAGEISAWIDVFTQVADVSGQLLDHDVFFQDLLRQALEAEPDAGGLLAYNYLSGEPITQMPEGRPLIVRTPESRLTLPNFMRAQVYAAFATLSLGMSMLAREGVTVDMAFAHGGLFRTEGVAQRLLAAALGTPIGVGRTPGEGGSWGIALLAGYLDAAPTWSLDRYLAERVFADSDIRVAQPIQADLDGFATFMESFRDGLPIERAATLFA